MCSYWWTEGLVIQVCSLFGAARGSKGLRFVERTVLQMLYMVDRQGYISAGSYDQRVPLVDL